MIPAVSDSPVPAVGAVSLLMEACCRGWDERPTRARSAAMLAREAAAEMASRGASFDGTVAASVATPVDEVTAMSVRVPIGCICKVLDAPVDVLVACASGLVTTMIGAVGRVTSVRTTVG
jgi:hypothetical protein